MREREERLTELFRRHADDIHAYATWRVGRQDAADVVGEVFLVAWRSLDRVRAGEERGWLFGVARTVVLARRRGAAASALDERLVSSTGPEPGPDRLADDVALRDHVRRALDALGAQDREVLVMAAWFDLTPAEAAGARRIAPHLRGPAAPGPQPVSRRVRAGHRGRSRVRHPQSSDGIWGLDGYR